MERNTKRIQVYRGGNIVKLNKNTELLIKTVKSLSTAQGFYSRLNERINNLTSKELRKLDKSLIDEDFKDGLDVVLYLEC